MGDSFDKGAWRGVRKIRVILLPTFPSQLSFGLGDFSYFLARQHVPKRTRFLADRRWGFISRVGFVSQERRFLRMLKDAGIRDIKKHPVKGNSLKPLVQQYEEALCKLEKTVKVMEMGVKIKKKSNYSLQFIAAHD